MTMQETYRFIVGLRRRGWTDKQINDFIMYLESGEEVSTPEVLPAEVKEEDK